MTTKITYYNLNNATFVGVIKPTLSSVIVTDSTYAFNIGNTVSTSGGYIKILGSDFTTGTQIVLKTVNTKVSTVATTVTYISSTELRAQLPSSTAGTKLIFVVSNDGSTAGTSIIYA